MVWEVLVRIICSDHDFKETKRYPGIHEGWNRVGHAQVYYTNEKYYNIKDFHDIIKEFTDNIALFYLSGIYYIKMNYAAIILGRKHNIPVLIQYKLAKKIKVKFFGLQILRLEYYHPQKIKIRLFGFIPVIEIEKIN